MKHVSRKMLFILGVVIVAISFIIHLPIDSQKLLFGSSIYSPVYSDISSFYELYYSRANTTLPIPYRDYDFYMFPLNGLLLILITLIPYAITGNLASPISITIYYIVYSLIAGFAYMIFLKYYHLLVSYFRLNDKFLIFALFPSFIVYLIYDWTIFVILLLIAGVYRVISDSKPLLGYVYLSLIFLLQPIVFPILLVLLYLLLVERREPDARGVLFGLLISLSIIGLWLVLFPRAPQDLMSFVSSLTCRNCIYLLLTRNPDNDLVLPLGLGVLYALSLTIPLLNYRGSHGYLWKSLLLFIGIIVLGLDFVPQYMLYIVPLLVFTAPELIGRDKRFTFTLLVADFLNILVIILWFSDASLRAIMNVPGMPIRNNPWELASPIQWIAQTRNILLLLIMLQVYYAKLYIQRK